MAKVIRSKVLRALQPAQTLDWGVKLPQKSKGYEALAGHQMSGSFIYDLAPLPAASYCL